MINIAPYRLEKSLFTAADESDGRNRSQAKATRCLHAMSAVDNDALVIPDDDGRPLLHRFHKQTDVLFIETAAAEVVCRVHSPQREFEQGTKPVDSITHFRCQRQP